jgi:hypothetical protein
MSSFPQLSTGTITQYPLTKKIVTRTVSNALEDGSTIRLADPVSQISWDLSYSGLSQSEWAALSTFFADRQGGLETFTFADPMANLLSWSEDFSQAIWNKDALITIAPGIADPLQETSASSVTNTAQVAQGVVQQVSSPGSYTYCFSVYLRCNQACSVTLRCIASNGEQSAANLVGNEWNRYTLSVALSSTIAGVTFGILLPAGIALDVFGMQVEAQPAPGSYKKTSGPGGVYLNSRFGQDQLPVTVDAPGLYSTKFSIAASVIAS